MRQISYLLLALLPALAAGASEAWTNRMEVVDRHALASLTCGWSKNGLTLQLAATNHAAIEFRLAPDRKPDIRLISERLLPEDFEDQFQLWPAPSPATNVVSIALRRQSHAWMLYVADEPVAHFPEPWADGAVTIRHPVRALPPATARDPHVQRTAAFRFDDLFLTAATATNQFSKIIEVQGPHGVVLAGEPFDHDYRLRAAVQHNGGTNGLVFLVTDTGACHGFTASTDPDTKRLVFQLWQGGIASNAPRQVLSTVATELPAGQWTRMEVRIFDDRVVCLANRIVILRQRLPLPSGGRYGLIAETGQCTCFAEVSVSSHEDYPFESLDELRFHTLRQNGSFRGMTGEPLSPAGGEAMPVAFESPGDRSPREWLFGATDDGPHNLECCIQPRNQNDFACSLVAGWQGSAQPYYQLTCRQQGARRTAALEQVSNTNVTLLDAVELDAAADPLRLTLDALRPNELRGLVNGRLVVVACPAAPVIGAGGIRLEGRNRMRLSLPQFVSEVPVYAERCANDSERITDPSLHPGGSAGERWITMRDGLTWLQGDIMGRAKFRLPVVDPSTLHVAIPEGETNGQCTVSIRDGLLTVRTPALGANAAFTVAVASMPQQKAEGVGNAPRYTVNIEEDLLWVSCGNTILGRCHLPPLARARRARIEGFSREQLDRTLVCRENFFETLFSKPPVDWTINGGRICDSVQVRRVTGRAGPPDPPPLSCNTAASPLAAADGASGVRALSEMHRIADAPIGHAVAGFLTGQGLSLAANNFAGLWANVELSGDFCVELDAGSCMGEGRRPGDLNLTVASQSQATCDGYSITTAGWDPDLSQCYTRLFRNGELEDVSTVGTVPRNREAGARRGDEQPDAASRPDLCSWHALRFRRVGDQLSYLFDNEPILSWRDPAPLDAGSPGIWTYRNSIRLARARIVAEGVRPRPFLFWAVTNTPPAAAPESAIAAPGIRVNGRPVELLDPAIWHAADSVSQPRVCFRQGSDTHPEMRVTAREAGGTFLVAPRLPPMPAPQVVGWHFEVARHPEARFNFEFSAGPLDEKNPATPAKSCTGYSFVICGSDDPRGERHIAGRLALPPAASRPDANSRDCVWTPVDVWVPSEAAQTNRSLRIDGFGNLQPGDIQQGLAGNPPGAWYAVRNFHEIYSAMPEIEGPAAARAELDVLARKAAQLPPGRVNELRLPVALDAREPVIAWVVRPETDFGLLTCMDLKIPEALRVSSAFPWSSPLLPARAARLDGQSAVGWQDGNDYLVLLPRSPLPQPDASVTLQLELADGRLYEQRVLLAAVATDQPPVLLSCAMPDGDIQTFESRRIDPRLYRGLADCVLCCDDPQQGACIRFQNAGAPDARLDGRMLPVYNPVRTPLLQFRYKADPMAHVSLTAGRCNIAFSENLGTLAAPGATGILDNAWHTWLGAPLQTAGSGLLRHGIVAHSAVLRVGSRGEPDQTGCFSAIAFDDIASGPAVGPKYPLVFRLNYSARHGLAEVLYALAAGPAPWTARTETERAGLRWIAITNLQVVVPDLSTLPEGTHHLFAKARGASGAWSAVSDIPFLLARQPPQVTCSVHSISNRYNGTCLDIDIVGNPAPPLVRDLRLSFLGKPLDLTTDNGRYSYLANGVHLEIDWPWLLRKSLRNYKDGDTLTLLLDGIADAARNATPALEIPIKLAFANDQQPPTVLPLQHTTNLLVYAPQFHGMQDFFNDSRQVTALEPLHENGCSFVPFRCMGGDNQASLSRQFAGHPWDPEDYPWLALSVRIDSELAGGAAPFELRLLPSGLTEQAAKPKNGNAYVWSLPTTENQPFVVGHADWKPGQWVDLLVNVRDLLRDRCKLSKACPISELSLVFPAKARCTLQVRGMAILAPWGPADVLKFRAYDLNGIGGLVWQNGGKAAKTGIRPARLTLPPDDAQWLKLRVADQPGNLSQVFMIPLPPNDAPIPENLPLEVDVEE